MKRRRVLVLNHFAVPLGEPGGTRHTELFGALEGWDHLIVAARTNPSTRRAQRNRPGFRFVPVTPYRGNGVARICSWISYALGAAAWSLADRRGRPEVVYASSPHLLAAAAGAVIATALRTPLVLEIRDMWPRVLVDMGQLAAGSAVHRVLVALETWLYRRADRIVVLTPGVARSLIETGVGADRITVIPNAADPSHFDIDMSRDDARTRYGFDKVTFVYTGAHGPANGLDLLIDAAAEVGDGIDVVLVGDGVSRSALMARVRSMGLGNVRFVAAIPKSEMPALLLAADVGVHCLADVPLFRYGVSPNKLYDYMAAGRPVLTNTPGEVGTLVAEAEAGVAVAPGGLAAGMSRMLDADARSRWGRNGRHHVVSTHSRSRMVELLASTLDGVGPGPRGQHRGGDRVPGPHRR